MKIFEVGRNDICPCGSGRKFKKCCQERVEEAVRRIGRVIGLGDCTAEGREIVETLGFMCGMQAEEEGRMQKDLVSFARSLVEEEMPAGS